MAGRPSDPLLAFLRDSMRRKRVNTAMLAERVGVDRGELKQRLAGAADLTVDEFIRIADALQIGPAQLGVAGTAPTAPPTGEVANEWEPDPTGKIARQVLRLGFALGIDLFVVFDTRGLESSGVPPAVLARFPEQLPIKLDAKYHVHNRPRFLDDAFECMLSFDALYTCTFPWSAFRQVTFHLPQDDGEAPPPSSEPSRPGGHLRVVK